MLLMRLVGNFAAVILILLKIKFSKLLHRRSLLEVINFMRIRATTKERVSSQKLIEFRNKEATLKQTRTARKWT